MKLLDNPRSALDDVDTLAYDRQGSSPWLAASGSILYDDVAPTTQLVVDGQWAVTAALVDELFVDLHRDVLIRPEPARWGAALGRLQQPEILNIPRAITEATVTVFAAEVASWLDQVNQRLTEVELLPDGWDDEGGPAPSQEIVGAAYTMLSHLQIGTHGPPRDTGSIGLWDHIDMPVPDVCPISGGTIQLEWRSPKRYLEITFLDERTVIILRREDGEYHVKRHSVTDVEAIRKRLDWFVQPSECSE